MVRRMSIGVVAAAVMSGSVSPEEAQEASDGFNRAAIGADWTAVTGGNGNLTISTNTVTAGEAYWSADAFGDNHYSEVEVVTAGSFAPAVRMQAGARTYYYAFYDGTTGLGIWRYLDGEFIQLTNDSVSQLVAGDKLRLTATGNAIVASVNGVTESSTTNSDIPSGGAPGMLVLGGAVDNWLGGPLA